MYGDAVDFEEEEELLKKRQLLAAAPEEPPIPEGLIPEGYIPVEEEPPIPEGLIPKGFIEVPAQPPVVAPEGALKPPEVPEEPQKPEEPKPPSVLGEKPEELKPSRPEFIPGYRPEPGKVDKAREFLKETTQQGEQADVQDTVNSILRGGSDQGVLSAMEGLYRMVEAKTKDTPWLSTVHENAKNQGAEVEKMRETIRTGLPIDKEFEESLTGQLTSGAGQVVATAPFAAVPGPAGWVIGGAVSFGQLYDEGRKDYADTQKRLGKSFDDKEADEAATKYALVAAPMDLVADKFMLKKALANQVGKSLKNVIGDIARTVGSGALSEGGQQLWLNTVAKLKSLVGFDLAGYDPDRALTEGVAESAFVGGVLSGGATAVGAGTTAALEKAASVAPAVPPAIPPPIPPAGTVVPPAGAVSPAEAPTTPGAQPPPLAPTPGITPTGAPGVVEAPPVSGVAVQPGAPPVEGAPPRVPGVPPPIPGAPTIPSVVPPPFPPEGAVIEPGPSTPAGQAVIQYVGKQNLVVKQVADKQAQNLKVANAPKTADAIQQVAGESNQEASVTAAEFLAQIKAREAAAAGGVTSPPIPAAQPPPLPSVTPPPIPGAAVAPPAIPAAPAAVAAPTPAARTEPSAVVVGGQVFTGDTYADAVIAAHTAVGPDAMRSAQAGWVDSKTGRFTSHEIYRAHLVLNQAIDAAGGNMEALAVAEAQAQFAEAQARDEEINSQIVSPGGEQVVQTGIKRQEALVSVRPSQELAMPLAGVTVPVAGVDAQGQPVTARQPAAQALNDSRNDRTVFQILLNCLT